MMTVDPRHLFEGSNIAPLPPNDPPLHFIRRSSTTETVMCAVSSAAMRWIASATIFFASPCAVR